MIDVALTPAALRPAAVAVVIDVLRATSTAAQALAAGYEAVLCVDTVEHAAAMRRPGRVLAAERRCVKPPGFDQGNSPLDAAVRSGSELVLATTNGAPTIVAAARCAPIVLLASLLNLDAVGEALRAATETSEAVVQLVCCGTDGAAALEDTYLAGRLCQQVGGERTDAALIAEAVADRFQTPLEALRAGAHAATLGAVELGPDIEYCALESRLAVVPHVAAASERIAVVRGGAPEPQRSVAEPQRGVAPDATNRHEPTNPHESTNPHSAIDLDLWSKRFVHRHARTAAQAILDQGAWCVLEFCVHVPSQRWEARLLIFDLTAEAVADVVSQEIRNEAGRDARLTACDRRTLRPRLDLGAHLCFLAESSASALR